MAVFTKITDNQFSEIISSYNIGEFVKAEGISEGVENTNYRIFTDTQKYILTIYEKRVDESDLPFFMGLQQYLNENNFPCPKPIANKDNQLINKLTDTDGTEKSYTIVSFIKGKWPKTITNNEVSKAAEALAKLHNKTAKNEKLTRPNNMGKYFWLQTYTKIQKQAENKYSDLAETFALAKSKIENFWPKNLPQGVIHADYFPDNVMFDKSKISGVIDFYMACKDIYAYDLAIAINAWCFEKDYSFNITKAKMFLNSYNAERGLSDQELKHLPTLCVGASMRFLSTRLHDMFNITEDAEVNIKEPREYIEKLKFHLQVSDFSQYGI